jgi:predicted nucleic acid-binding protein
LILADSSVWLAFFADETGSERFAEALSQPADVLVPTIVLHEVFKVVLRGAGEGAAFRAAAALRRGRVVELDATVAVQAARLAVEHQLPTADSLIYATARQHGVVVWTQDAHFRGLPDVEFFEKE